MKFARFPQCSKFRLLHKHALDKRKDLIRICNLLERGGSGSKRLDKATVEPDGAFDHHSS
jgi:hypothetical protein